MNKTFSYIVTKTENYSNPDSSNNVFSNILGVFHNKQDAIYFVDKLMEEYRMESGIMLKSSYSDRANCVYSTNFKYISDPNFGKGSKTTCKIDREITYNVDRYEIK